MDRVSFTKNEKTVIAAIYARVSSGNQINGYSLNEQVRLAREQCEKKGWRLRYIFKENGISGKNIDRPKFQAMLRGAEKGCFDVLVFWKLDRFCRSLLDVVNVEKKLRECGVKIFSITESIDTTTSNGRFVFRTIASAAEWEREIIKERSRMGMKGLAMQHKWPNRLPPIGYNKKKDGHLMINEKEASLVKNIFKRYIKLKSMPQLAYELNEKNITNKRGNKWNTVAIKKILENQIYIGNYKIAGIEDYVQEYRILKDKIFKKVEKTRKRFIKKKQAMPINRKQKKVDMMINKYLSFIREEDEVEDQNVKEEMAERQIIL
jgi:site-specific DNA recombinase